MRYSFLLILLLASSAPRSQVNLEFNKLFVESEDRWVAFPIGVDSTYPFGFIYIDPQAGLTLNYEGNFRIAPTGEFIPERIDSTNIKYRLEPNQVRIAFIPEDRLRELEVDLIPDWLKFYKIDSGSIERLYQWGYMYNGWGQCGKALTYLERAKEINAEFNRLRVELAYSYNCLGRYEEATQVLKIALEMNPTDAYTNKEMIYALMKSGRLEEAAENCRKALEICPDKTYNGENTYNILYNFYIAKDKKNFNLWLAEAKKWNSDKPDLVRSMKMMEDVLGD